MTMKTSTVPRFRDAQRHRTLWHPRLPQPDVPDPAATATSHGAATAAATANCTTTTTTEPTQSQHTFIVAADTQLGMAEQNERWESEMALSRRTVDILNQLQPRPLFCCMCGDLVDMTSSMFVGKTKAFDPSRNNNNNGNSSSSKNSNNNNTQWTAEECEVMQDQQNADFQRLWQNLHPDIALICLCGNHDVGNRPTRTSIDKFKNAFGDDYLAFWANGTYNVVINSNLCSDPSAAEDLYEAQLVWLDERLRYAQNHRARQIFVYSHHPWFLYDENEVADEMTGTTVCGSTIIPDGYFHIPLPHRRRVLQLFQKYQVTAAFCGHFHQNLQAKASFGMDLIVTGSLSVVLDSSGNPNTFGEPKEQGFRVVSVRHDLQNKDNPSTFQHEFRPLSSFTGTAASATKESYSK